MTENRVVLFVVVFLGLVTLLGMGGLIWLVDHGSDAAGIAVVAGPTGTALGALGALLVSTRSVDVGATEDAARNEALAEVGSLAE